MNSDTDSGDGNVADRDAGVLRVNHLLGCAALEIKFKNC